MKLRFLMPPHWKNAVRDKVIGKKQIYLETQMVNAAMKLKDACPLEEKLWPT